ncbi:MAG: RNA-directed DNA polymerase [Rhodoferax sp.]|nr:RNA-directed DNA polymerase [Rhodoferax sp.]
MTQSHFDFAALYQAWQTCRRGKRGTRKAQRYEIGLLDNLVDTAQALQQKSWRPSRASRFVTLHPKPREILAAEFGDRVVHHVLVPWFEKHFEPVFIHDSFANRCGKGTHAAVDRLQAFTRAYSRDLASTPLSQRFHAGWYLQLDIASFFNSIDRRTLFGMLHNRIARDLCRGALDARHAEAKSAADMLHLARVLLTGNPALDARYVGNPAHLQRVPAHKQLANAAPEKGLPIGNLTSQFFANVYLNGLDQFIKHTLKARHYVRYVDDFVLLHQDPCVLEDWCAAIKGFLQERLGLGLRDAGRLQPIGNGIDFLGYIVRPDYRLVRQRVVGHMHERLDAHAAKLRRTTGALVSPPATSNAVQATLASYWGHMRHARARSLQAQVFARHAWLGHILKPAPDGTLQRVDRPGIVTSLVSQWTFFRARYPQHVLLVQVGNRWECQGPLGNEIPSTFLRQNAQRRGLPQTWAVSAAQVPALKRQLTRKGQSWCEVCENGYLQGGMKRRQLVALWPVFAPSGNAQGFVGAVQAAKPSSAAIVPSGTPTETLSD